MASIIKRTEQLIEWIGNKVSWLCFVLIILIIFDVILRYLLSNTKTWVIELEWHLFALIFLLGAAATFQKDEHVRVDLFYSRFSEKKKAIVDILGILLLLMPWCCVVIYYGVNYGVNSWTFQEGSPNPGGLPARYLIKFSIAIGFALLLLQAVLSLIRNINKLKSN